MKTHLSPIHSCFIHHGVIHLNPNSFIHHLFIHLSKFYHSSFFHQTFIHLSWFFSIIHASLIEILFCQLSFVTYSFFSFMSLSTIIQPYFVQKFIHPFQLSFQVFLLNFFINHSSKIFIHLEFYLSVFSICPMFIYHPSINC